MAKKKYFISCLEVVVKKNFYTGLWEIRYMDGYPWGGPYKTKREAIERLEHYISNE